MKQGLRLVKRDGYHFFEFVDSDLLHKTNEYVEIAKAHQEVAEALNRSDDLIVYWKNGDDTAHGWIDKDYFMEHYNSSKDYVIVLAKGHTISLVKTYCTATDKHLKHLGMKFKNVHNHNNDKYLCIEEQPNRITVSPITYIPNDNYKQVQLNNLNKWEFVDIKPLHETINYPCILLDSDNDELFIVYGYDEDKKEFYNHGGSFLGSGATCKLANYDEAKILMKLKH